MLGISFSLFITGLFFGSGPCAASCGPFLITYAAGMKKGPKAAIGVYLLFSLARIFIYACLGVAVFLLSKFAVEGFLGSAHKYVLAAGGAFIAATGALMALGKTLDFKFCRFLRESILDRDKKTVIAAGVVIGLLPCAPLLSVLSYLGMISQNWFSSLVYSVCFGIGTFISPLILLVVLAGLIPRWLENKSTVYYRAFKRACGCIIVLLGVHLISRAF
ncbi:MAG: sulfite exporter TauE/SafE family protein [Candidatus Omnitrophica bacterium]|nr:sulfite exporter TauE/SafE family protein [Candidatus Omnitrophota bacterium]MDD5552985.1 sulfite exporter TauE/SafE family protein [Candidatus Omnitrophota bacterium]